METTEQIDTRPMTRCWVPARASISAAVEKLAEEKEEEAEEHLRIAATYIRLWRAQGRGHRDARLPARASFEPLQSVH